MQPPDRLKSRVGSDQKSARADRWVEHYVFRVFQTKADHEVCEGVWGVVLSEENSLRLRYQLLEYAAKDSIIDASPVVQPKFRDEVPDKCVGLGAPSDWHLVEQRRFIQGFIVKPAYARPEDAKFIHHVTLIGQ